VTKIGQENNSINCSESSSASGLQFACYVAYSTYALQAILMFPVMYPIVTILLGHSDDVRVGFTTDDGLRLNTTL